MLQCLQAEGVEDHVAVFLGGTWKKHDFSFVIIYGLVGVCYIYMLVVYISIVILIIVFFKQNSYEI